jgi:hypothetical protein
MEAIKTELFLAGHQQAVAEALAAKENEALFARAEAIRTARAKAHAEATALLEQAKQGG